jgi:hypothetical protein
MSAKVIYMDRTINYMLQSGKEKEITVILNNSILKDFEKMIEGNFITVHYTVLNEKNEVKENISDEKEIK